MNGLNPYNLTFVDEAGRDLTASINITILDAGTTDTATIYADYNKTAKSNPANAVVTATLDFWSPAATVDVQVEHVALGTKTLLAGVAPTDHRIVFGRNTHILTSAATYTGNLQVDGDTVLGSAGTDTLTVNAAATCASTLAVTGAATFAGAVTLGDAAGDAITVTGTPTFAQTATFTGAIVANGNVTLGNAASDTITVVGTGLCKSAGGVEAAAADDVTWAATASIISKTSGGDAEAVTLGDGTPGQVLVITLAVDGGGDVTVTPTTKTGFVNFVLADAGDTISLMFADATRGWVILGTAGVAAPPVIALS
jgi:hypothetical protein